MPEIQNIPTTQYIGPRIIPHLWDPILWDASTQYDALAVVQYNGVPYIARYVPPLGTLPTDTEYWVRWADFNAQMAQLQQTVETYRDDIDQNAADIDTLEAIVPRSAFTSTNTVQKAINDEVTARQQADSALSTRINDEVTARQQADTALGNRITSLAEQARNEIWVVIGDSFSDPNLNSYVSQNIQVWPTIIQRNGVAVKNYAKAGAGYVHATGNPFLVQANNAASDTSYDHNHVTRVIVYGFVNDVASSENTSTMINNLRQMVTVLRTAFKYADIQIYPNWYVRQLSIQDQTYFSYLQQACVQAHVSYHQESAYLLMNYNPENVFMSDNLHPNQLGQNILASYFVDKEPSYAGRINGALTIVGVNTFDNMFCNNSGVTVEGTTYGVNESCYDGFEFKCKTAMNSITISGIPANSTSDIIIGLHFDSRMQRLWTNGLVIPILAYGNVSNGYRGYFTGYIQNDNLYVYVRPINEAGWNRSELTFNFAVEANFKLR